MVALGERSFKTKKQKGSSGGERENASQTS